MAKKRTAKRARASGFFKKKSRSSGRSGDSTLMMTVIGAGLYGAGREYASNALAPVTSKIPLGNIADEVVLGTLGYFAAKGKFGNNTIVKSIGKAAVTIEAARLGQAIVTGQVSMNGAGTSTTDPLSNPTIF